MLSFTSVDEPSRRERLHNGNAAGRRLAESATLAHVLSVDAMRKGQVWVGLTSEHPQENGP